MVSKSLNTGLYGSDTQYDYISKFQNEHTNDYEPLVEGAMSSKYTGKEWFENPL